LMPSPHFRNIGIIGCGKINSTNFLLWISE
jgi:hypothetical protein